MPKQLINLDVQEVSSVDRPANKRKFLVIKRADADTEPDDVEKKAMTVQQVLDHDEALEHACEDKWQIIEAFQRSMRSILASEDSEAEQERLAVQSVREFLSLMRPIVEVLGETEEVMMADKTQDKTVEKEASDAAVDARVAELETQNQALQAQLDEVATEKADLTKRLEELEAAIAKKDEDPEDIWKGVHPAVRAEVEALKKKAEDAEAVAKRERDAREQQECIKKASGYTNLPINADDDWTLFKAIRELPEAMQDRIDQIFKAMNEQLADNALLKTRGVDPNADELDDSAVAKAAHLANQMIEKSGNGSLSFDQALGRVFSQNPGLYAQYTRETTTKA